MEINVTELVAEDCSSFSNSIHESGLKNIGEITWRNACEYARENMLCTTDAELDKLRDWIADFGAWDSEEIAAMSDVELNAMLVQFVSGDVRESEHYDSFEEYSEQAGGRLLKDEDDDGKWLYYVGN